MNKKILSLAIAAAVAAPMAAQADVSVNGALSMDMYQDSTAAGGSGGLTGSDAGTSKVEFNVKSGNSFAKYAMALNKTIADGSSPGTREAQAGINVGGFNLTIARQANAYNMGVKVDTMTANFLEARNRAGGVSKVPSFVNGLIGVSGSAGDVKYNVQYGPAYATGSTLTNPVLAGVQFKAGPATIGLGYYGDHLGNASSGVSAKMKFGDIAVAASFESADGYWTAGGGGNDTTLGTAGAGSAQSIIFVDASMPVGSGTIGLGLGQNTTQSTTFSRLSYQMKVDAGTVTFGGSNADGDTRIGAGIKVSF
jgi:hypothetical protein